MRPVAVGPVPVVAGAHEASPGHRTGPAARPRSRSAVGVAVEADQPQAGQIGEEALGVPARAERGVDQHRARTRRRRVGSERG